MRFSVAKADLSDAISVVGSAASSAEGDVSSHFLFRIGLTSNKLELVASSGRLFSSYPIQGVKMDDESDPFTVEAWRLKGWVSIIGDAVINFESSGADVTAQSGKFTQKFRSLSPSSHNLPDKAFVASVKTATIDAKYLSHIIKTARLFASTDEVGKSDVVAISCHNSEVTSTDKISVLSFLSVADLAQCGMKIHVKDVPSILNFLNSVKGKVDIQEVKDRSVFFVDADRGSVYGETRYQTVYPNLTRKSDSGVIEWEFSPLDLKTSAQHCFFGSSKKDSRIFVSVPSNDKMKVSMLSDGGGTVSSLVDVQNVVVTDQSQQVKDSIPINYNNLMSVVDVFQDETKMKVWVSLYKDKPMLRFVKEVPNTKDAFHIVLSSIVV